MSLLSIDACSVWMTWYRKGQPSPPNQPWHRKRTFDLFGVVTCSSPFVVSIYPYTPWDWNICLHPQSTGHPTDRPFWHLFQSHGSRLVVCRGRQDEGSVVEAYDDYDEDDVVSLSGAWSTDVQKRQHNTHHDMLVVRLSCSAWVAP